MKKQSTILACIVAAMMLTGCCCSNKDLKRVATGEPIIPVRITGCATEVYLTDYLPSVDLKNLGEVQLTEGYDSLVVGDGMLTLYGNPRRVGVMTFGKGKCRVDIPILPLHSYYQGLTTLGITDNMLFLEIDEEAPKPTHYLCFVQNQVLPEDVIFQGEDGHMLFDLTRIPKLKGRSYLRIYAWSALSTGYPSCNGMSKSFRSASSDQA